MYTHEVSLRVRYSETDQMGYMYYGNYAAFYEVARVEMLRSLGLDYKSLEQGGVFMPVLDLSSRFIGPARYDDLIRIVTHIRTMPSTRIRFDYELFNENLKLINTGSTTLVFVKTLSKRPCAAPAELLANLASFF